MSTIVSLIVAFSIFAGLVPIHREFTSNKIYYLSSKTGKPFVERDADGYMTLESYQSHIKYYGNGSIETDLWALTQTRQWAKNMKACRKLREHINGTSRQS